MNAARARLFWPLGAGLAAVLIGTALGWNADALSRIVSPAPIVRAALVGAMAWLAVEMLQRALVGINRGGDDLRKLVRGVRYAFLAVAAVAAGIGWLLASALPLIVALVIAGVDVVETSFLLIVVGANRMGGASDQAD
jgi:hypothetical membrane protein